MIHEFLDNQGVKWIVRSCDGTPGCTALEAFAAPSDEESAQEIHFPAEVCNLIGKALIARAPEAEKEKLEARLEDDEEDDN